METCNAETIALQHKKEQMHIGNKGNALDKVNDIDQSVQQRSSLMENTFLENDVSWEPPVKNISGSDLTEAQCNKELKSSPTIKRKKRKKKKKSMEIVQRDCQEGTSSIRSDFIKKELCCESAVDINPKGDLGTAESNPMEGQSTLELQLSSTKKKRKKRKKKSLQNSHGDFQEGPSSINPGSIEKGSCLESEVDIGIKTGLISANSALMEGQSNVEMQSSPTKRKKKKKKQKSVQYSQGDFQQGASSIEKDSCLKSEVDSSIKTDLKSTESDLTEGHCNTKLDSLETKKKRRRKRSKTVQNSQRDLEEDASKLKSGFVERDLCTGSDVKTSTDLKNAESDTMGAQCNIESEPLRNRKRKRQKRFKKEKNAEKDCEGNICKTKTGFVERDSCLKSEVAEMPAQFSDENKVKLPTVVGQTSLDHSAEGNSCNLENKLERVQVTNHANLANVGERIVMEKTFSSNGDFACKENKDMAELKDGVNFLTGGENVLIDKTSLHGDSAFGESKKMTHIKNKFELEVPAKEDNTPQVSQFSCKGPEIGCARKKLLILDINGVLADIVMYAPKRHKADIVVGMKPVFKRPFCDDFLQFCFKKFNVGVWSSRAKKNVDRLVDFLIGDSKHKLLFVWNQSHCTRTRSRGVGKPLFLKELRKLWENVNRDLPWTKGDYDASNTLLLDDSPQKALHNPVYTAIFPHSYQFNDATDASLGPGGDLRVYLERLAEAKNIQEFVAQNPFGQQAIAESSASRGIYCTTMNAGTCQSQDVPSGSLTCR